MNAENLAKAQELIQRFPQKSSALIPILHLVEEEFGYIPQEEVGVVADVMGVTSAYVESVLSFYTLFHRQPTGKYLIQVCRGLSCQLMGADELSKFLYEDLGVERNGTTEDGMFTVEAVECVALCKNAPAVQINLEFYPNMTKEKLQGFLDKAREEVRSGA
ncbi:MAG: NAD(P)H-dependent oxidoreductase subunit E [Thermaerobacter sp.]|nr:NAD(P)H-dependent oxidoreductase subunit E [Thermaerobacter sp.]